MSTKIHHGYRYRTQDGTHADPFALGAALRAALGPSIEAAYRVKVAALAAAIYDGTLPEALTAGEQCGQDSQQRSWPLLDAELHVLNARRQIAATGRRNPTLDFSCDVSILPDPDDRTTLYLLVFCEQYIDEAMCAIDGVDKYQYFNNTDRPAEYTAEAWDERREIWDRVLGDDAPVTRGLTWSLEDPCFISMRDRDAFVAALPDTATRARHIALRRAVAEIEFREAGSTAELLTLISNVQAAALSDTDTIADIEAGLVALTFEDLIGPGVLPT